MTLVQQYAMVNDLHDEKEQQEPELPQREVSELKDLLQRTQANFENYRKQVDKRNEEMQKFAARQVILQLLPILDTFELALKSMESGDKFREGVELIYQQLRHVLETQEVQEMDCMGKLFDPYLHEPLFKEAGGSSVNMIIEVYQKGYTMHGQVIRHAKVKIGTAQEEQERENEAQKHAKNGNKDNHQNGGK